MSLARSLALSITIGAAACSSAESSVPAASEPDAGADVAGDAEVDAAPPRCTPDRTADDRPDDEDGYQVRIFYVLPADGVDEELDRNGKIETSALAWNAWLKKASGGSNLRLDTCDGKLDIGFFRMKMTDAQVRATGAYVREQVQKELAPKNPKKIIGAYYGGSSTYSCGGGAWPPELVGRVAAMYLKGTPPGSPTCDSNELGVSIDAPGYFEFGLLHEIMHTLGAAAECAPHMINRGHVSEDNHDLMYGGTEPWYPGLLDVGRDDYWGTGRDDCVDVSKSVFVDPLPDGAKLPPSW